MRRVGRGALMLSARVSVYVIRGDCSPYQLPQAPKNVREYLGECRKKLFEVFLSDKVGDTPAR